MTSGRQVHLSFRSGSSATTDEVPLRLTLDVLDHIVAQKWWLAFKACLRERRLVEKNFLLLGARRPTRTLEDIHTDLRRVLRQLSFQGADPAVLDRTTLNLLHHEFEVRIGQVWNPNPNYLRSDHVTRHAIRQINHLVHEAEALLERQQSETPKPSLLVSFFGCRRFPLTREDLGFFDLKHDFGDAFLHYCQLGKTHLEAFVDGDSHIQPDNINGLRYYTGEFDIFLRPGVSPDDVARTHSRLRDWLRAQGLDPSDPRLALGHLKVARLNDSSLQLMPDSFAAERLLATQPDLFRIEAHEHGRRVQSLSLDYDLEESETLSLGLSQNSPLRRFFFKLSAKGIS